jgi:hypothetical protein
VWTEADLESLGWHDNAVHAVAVEPAPPHPGRLRIDLDYIVEWVHPTTPGGAFRFRVCPATKVFKKASDLTGDLSFVGQSFEPSIDAIERFDPDEHGGFTWIIQGHEFTLRLRAPGFVQYLRQAPTPSGTQRLAPSARGGISFGETAFAQR